MNHKILKRLLGGMGLLIFIVAMLIYCSPYGQQGGIGRRVIVKSILIKTPIKNLYQYLGNSANARKWSVFVEKIIPINQDGKKDGELGSKRRCFGKDNDIVWDEEIVAIEEFKRRELSVFNAKGFMTMVDDLRTEQLYESVNADQTKLSLTLYFEKEQNCFDELKMYLAAYEIGKIFQLNLQNIKYYNES